MREWFFRTFKGPEEEFLPGERVQVSYTVPTDETGLVIVWPAILPWRRFKKVQEYATVVEFPIKPSGIDDWIGEALFGPQVSVQLENGTIYNIHSEWVHHAATDES